MASYTVSQRCPVVAPPNAAFRKHITRAPRLLRLQTSAAAITSPNSANQGHAMLLQGLGAVGDVAPSHVPWLLRLAHIQSLGDSPADSESVVQQGAMGVLVWKTALERGLLPDDMTLGQLQREKGSPWRDTPVEALQWPDAPLRTALIRGLSQLHVSRFASLHPSVLTALLKNLLECTCTYHRTLLGDAYQDHDDAESQPTDPNAGTYMTAEQLDMQLLEQRAARLGTTVQALLEAERGAQGDPEDSENENEPVFGGAYAAGGAGGVGGGEGEVPQEVVVARQLAGEMVEEWRPAMTALTRASAAFLGVSTLLGEHGFQVDNSLWTRRGWAELDSLRSKLDNLKELRDLVRSLGRGGGWGPLRRAPTQHLDMGGRPGLLRTVLEAQETRGLTRSDDISRLLPSEAAMLARGSRVRQAKLLFYARLAEKALQTYERDGWGEFPTRINIDRREIRPTADRGPILLCVDTSGSMRGPRETVAKALALECMRAAKEQERDCYVFAFAGVREVVELELNDDAQSIDNLLSFLEKTFNGGSDFNEPVTRCLTRLTNARWANSDILLVSDGELRQPAHEVMRKLAGAKDKLGLRVHGLIVGSPEQKKADPAVLRSLCSHTLPNGKNEVLVTEFSDWASVNADEGLQFDWDDVAGNSARREAGLRLEKLRQEEIKRLRLEQKVADKAAAMLGGRPKKQVPKCKHDAGGGEA